MRYPPIDPPESSSSFSEASFNRMAEALLAREGFAGVAAIAAELVGARVEILVPRPGSTGANGTVAERFVAELVAGGLPPWPPGVTEVVPIVVGGEVQGAVVVSGEFDEGADEHLRSAARAALTGIAILDTREEARRDQASGLIADLLAGRPLRAGDVAGRASRTRLRPRRRLRRLDGRRAGRARWRRHRRGGRDGPPRCRGRGGRRGRPRARPRARGRHRAAARSAWAAPSCAPTPPPTTTPPTPSARSTRRAPYSPSSAAPRSPTPTGRPGRACGSCMAPTTPTRAGCATSPSGRSAP